MKKILVIGGTRFFGLKTVEKLAQEGHEVVVLSHSEALNLPENVEFIQGERNDPEILAKLKDRNFDVVWDNIAYHEEDLDLMLKALEGNYKKYILTSSAWADTDLDYGINKSKCEERLKSEPNINYVIIRPCMVFGEGDHSGRLEFYFNELLNEGEVHTFHDPNTELQLLYVEDLVEIIKKLATEDTESGVYKISPKEKLKISEVFNLLNRGAVTTIQDSSAEDPFSYETGIYEGIEYDYTPYSEWLPKTGDHIRLNFMIATCEEAGDKLLELKEKGYKGEKVGTQIKSEVDGIIEKLILGKLLHETVISEEKYESNESKIDTNTYWLIDPIDGTGSYVEGFPGYCVQMSYVLDGEPIIGVVHAPDLNVTYFAIKNKGAFKKENTTTRLKITPQEVPLRYVDNRPAKGETKKALDSIRAEEFVECGSFGVKICFIADNKADVFYKDVKFKTWDTAPGELILKEAGGFIQTLGGKDIDYSGNNVYYESLIASNKQDLITEICKKS